MTDSSISILNRSITSQEYDNSLFEKFTFQSVITKLEKPVGKGCPVYVMNKSTGQIIYKTETDEKSTIYVPNLRKYNKYLIIATDIQDVYNTVAFDVNWDFSKDAAYNYTLDYYDMADLDNVQAIFEYMQTTRLTDNNVVSNYAIPFVEDSIGLSWSSSGNPRRESIKGIPGFYFNGSSSVSLPKGLFYQKLPFTFEAYFKLSEVTTVSQYIVHQTFNGKSWSISVDPSLNLIFSRPDIITGLSNITMTSLTNLKLNTNYHVAISFDGSLFYLFLNGVLQTTAEDVNGIPYLNTPTIIGYQCKNIIANPIFTQVCKYTTNFDVLFVPFSYNPIIYNNPSDSFANYVSLLIKNNKLTPQSMIDDKAKNTRFDNNITEVNKNFFSINSTYNSTITAYKSLSLGTQDFCIELSTKVLYTTGASPTLASNANSSTEWTTASWYFLFNSQTTPNKYTFSSYGTNPWALTYPPITREQIDIAIVREGTKLRFYVNGFLDSEYTIASNFNFDSKISSYFSFGREIGFNLYNLKLTIGNCRYKAEYTPEVIDILDKDILAAQYQYAFLPFKKIVIDSSSPLNISSKDISLSSLASINGTKSALFNGTSSYVLFENWYTSQERFSVEMFVKPLTNATPVTLFSLYSPTAELINIGISNNKLSYFANDTWTELDFEFDLEKFNHLAFKRDKTTFKILAEGSLIQSITIPAKLGSPLKASVGASQINSKFFNGYINNVYIYKNYFKYEDSYTVPVEEIVVDPGEEIEPEVVVNSFTTAALDFENGMVDKIPTTTWTKTGSTSAITNTNSLYGDNSFETKVIGDSITLPANHINQSNVYNPYTIDFYMLYKGGTKGNSRNDDVLSLFSKNTGSDKYLCLSDSRQVSWTQPHYKKGKKVFPNEITHYTVAYDGSATRLFINDKLEAIAGGTMDFTGGYPLTFGYHAMNGYETWAFGTRGLWDNFNIFQGVATKTRDKDPNEDYLVCDLTFEGADNSSTIIDHAPSKPIWLYDGGSASSYVRLIANSNTPKFKTGYSYLNKSYYNNSTIKSTNVDLNFGSGDWTLSFEFVKNDDALYCNFISVAASNYTTDAEKLFYFCVMGSGYTNIPTLQKKLSFVNEKYMGQDAIKNAVIANPYTTPNVLVSKTTIQSGVAYKVDIVFKSGVMNLYINNKFDTSISFNIPINLSPDGLGTTIGGVPFSNVAGLNGAINYVKAYKGIAITPENALGRIGLDFNMDVVDKHGNSTWTNNNVTFSNMQSYSGYSAVYNGSSSTLTSNSEYLNYELNNFIFEYDIKLNANNGAYALTNNTRSNTSGSIWFGTAGQSLWLDFKDKPSGAPMDIKALVPLNTYYNQKMFRINNSMLLKYNDVITSCCNFTTGFNLTSGGLCTLGGSSSGFDSTTSINGSIDSFKSFKENLLEANSTVYKTSPNVNVIVENESVYSTFNGNPSGASYGTVVLNDSPVVANFIAEVVLFIKNDNNNHGIFNFRTPNYATNSMDTFGYSVYISGSNLKIGKGSNSASASWSEIATLVIPTKFQNNAYHTMKVIANGNNFKIYLDNEQMIEASDSTYSTATRFAWCTYLVNGWTGVSSRVKSIKISDLSGNQLYYKDWRSTLDFNVDIPAISMPFETSTKNAGYIDNLTTTNNGSLVFNTINGKKCVKFESGKYTTVNSHNIFNLGTNSNFYLEFDFYPVADHYHVMFSNGTTNTNNNTLVAISLGNNTTVDPNGVVRPYCLYIYCKDRSIVMSENSYSINSWNTVKVFRSGNDLTISLNDVEKTVTGMFDLNFSTLGTFFGKQTYGNTADFEGYMSNFKLFVGTSKIPEKYNPYSVLDLDFKPTNKSYLFKDNFGKCVIHPFNITQRDYLDGQYCLPLNGISQCLSLGKNPALNFGTDSFVLNFKIKPKFSSNVAHNFSRIIAPKWNSSAELKEYIMLPSENYSIASYRGTVMVILDEATNVFMNTPRLSETEINDITLTRSGNQFTLYLNDIVAAERTFTGDFNLNRYDDTVIGASKGTRETVSFLNATLYSIKMFRNTSDLSVLQNK